ncbi:MAG: hypothetical protein WC044_10325 [Crocinitomicaceae bacterium]
MKARKNLIFLTTGILVCFNSISQIANSSTHLNTKVSTIFGHLDGEQTEEYAPFVGPSFTLNGCFMRNKSLNAFIESYNQVNSTSLIQPMKSVGLMIGYKYGFTFSTQSSKGLPILWYIGQQKHGGSFSANLKEGYTRKIDYTQKDIIDIIAYYPLNRIFYLGGKMAFTTQTIDAYRMYGQDKVYDQQAPLTGVYRSFVGNFTFGVEFKANIKLNKWIYVSPSLAYQSTFGNGTSAYFTKATDQWSENESPNSYYFPSDYAGYLAASANYNILPTEGLLKPRNRIVQGSISILFNICHL